MPLMLYVECEILAISTHAFRWPYSSIRLDSFWVITSFSLMLASIWAIIGSEAMVRSKPDRNPILFICVVFYECIIIYDSSKKNYTG